MPTRPPVDGELSELIAEAALLFPGGPQATVEELRADALASGVWARGAVDPELVRVPTLDTMVEGIRVRWYGPETTRDHDVIVYFHGGGWMLGDIDSYDDDMRLLAQRSGRSVVSVNYRRTPEHPFPAPLDDCLTVIRHIASLPHRTLSVAGDSAGGNLALGAAVALADEALVDAVLAIYPVVDPGAFGNGSYTENGEGYLLTTDAMTAFWNLYAPEAATRGDHRLNLAAARLEGFPACVIATADYDPLRDEGRALASRMAAADVDVTYLPHPGLTHGFQQMVPRVPAATRAIESIYDAFDLTLRRAAARRKTADRMARL